MFLNVGKYAFSQTLESEGGLNGTLQYQGYIDEGVIHIYTTIKICLTNQKGYNSAQFHVSSRENPVDTLGHIGQSQINIGQL